MRLALLALSLAALVQCAFSVRFPPSLTRTPPKEAAFKPGEPFRLECEASVSPAPTFTWKRNGQVLDLTADSERYERPSGSGTLVLVSPGVRDDGSYQCLARNELGVAASNLTFLRPAMLGQFLQEPSATVRRRLGSRLALPCVPPINFPDAPVVWHRIADADGAQPMVIQRSNRINIDPVNGNLLFSNIQLSDKATYRCSVENRILRRAVQGGSYRLDVIKGAITSAAAQLMAQKPSFITALANRTLDLFCFFSGFPTPSIQWKKDSTEVSSGERLQLLDSGARLRLIDIDPDYHAGVYQCTGANEGGFDDAGTYRVRVASEPYWIQKPADVSVPEGGSHTFHCEAGAAAGDPKWLINGVPVSGSDSRFSPVGSEFQFSNLTVRDSLVVQCNVSNRYGYVFTNAYLSVLPPSATSDTKVPWFTIKYYWLLLNYFATVFIP